MYSRLEDWAFSPAWRLRGFNSTPGFENYQMKDQNSNFDFGPGSDRQDLAYEDLNFPTSLLGAMIREYNNGF